MYARHESFICTDSTPDDDSATRCNTLQHAATRCNTLQHTATRCNTLQHTATLTTLTLLPTMTLLRTAMYCNMLQHAATHCNTLQHTATHCNTDTTPDDDSLKQRAPYVHIYIYIYNSDVSKHLFPLDDSLRQRALIVKAICVLHCSQPPLELRKCV